MTGLLFIRAIESGDWEELKMRCVPFLVCIVCDTAALLIDLVAGVRKAKQRKEFRTSTGYKRTIDKALKYYSLLILCFLVDVIASLVVDVPYFTMLAGGGIILIEIKSWYENADKKVKKDVNFAAEIAAEILKSKSLIAKDVIEALKQNTKND